MIEHKLLDVFAGRMDSYGQDVPKGDDPAGGGMRVDAPLTPQLAKAHLYGEIGLGTYPTWHDQDGVLMASWGCADIDTGDWSEAFGLITALRAMGMVPHVERSRSKGWHVWLFPSAPVTAVAMRRSLKVAYAAIELPAKEANPKSETLAVGQVGNYVRLPYKAAMSTPSSRQCFLSHYTATADGFPVDASDWFYEFDSSFETSPDVINKWAQRWQEPRRAEVRVREYSDQELKDVIGSLRGDLMLFVKDGPKADRSAGLVALAYKLKSAGYTSTEAFNILCVADSHWGSKYESRGLASRDKYIIDILERAFA